MRPSARRTLSRSVEETRKLVVEGGRELDKQAERNTFEGDFKQKNRSSSGKRKLGEIVENGRLNAGVGIGLSLCRD